MLRVMEKIFKTATRANGMIAWNLSTNKMVLITHDYFYILVKELLADQGNELQLTKFAMRISLHMKVDNEDRHSRLQELLNLRLREKMENRSLLINEYSFHEDEARGNIDDFLEAYKFNKGYIDYAVSMSFDEANEIINISLRRKPKLVQKLNGQLGDQYGEIDIMRNEITNLHGSSFAFSIDIKSGVKYIFGDTGVHAQVI